MYEIRDAFETVENCRNFYDEYCHKGKIFWSYDNFSQDGLPVDSFKSSLTTDELLKIDFIRLNKEKIDSIMHPKGNILKSIFVNGQFSGYDGTMHTDHNNPKSFTCMLFVNPEWDKMYGGEFLLYTETGDEIVGGSTIKPGRLVVFPAHMKHRGLGPFRLSALLRVSVAFQYKYED